MGKENKKFDVVVIGGGPGGYVAAIKSAQLGMKVACIEEKQNLGGTCLNVGCIPSKALLKSSELYEETKHLASHGININQVSLDVKTMLARKSKIIQDLAKGIDYLFKKNNIEHIKSYGRLEGGGVISLKNGDKISAENIIIATGSQVASLPNIEIDEKNIISSTGALELNKLPKELLVIGGGYIGLELGSVWRRLGSKVKIIEFQDRILPGMDSEIAEIGKQIFEKQGIEFMLGHKLSSVQSDKNGVEATIEPATGGKLQKLKADKILMSVGRKPNTEMLQPEKAKVKLDDRGFIIVDEKYRATENIFAIGDVIGGAMLAHKAEEEGVAVAEIIAGQAGHVNYGAIPGVVYTSPEIATVGLSEEQAKESGFAYSVGKFQFRANSRARATGATEGMVKIITRMQDDLVLGVHIIGAEAGTMIAEAVLAMEYGASSEDIARTCHAHPTLSEAVKEAAFAAHGKAIHA